MDLTIEGKAYIKGTFVNCCIGIEQGKIAAIKKILKGDKHLKFEKKLILPSGIDIHVHFRDPGFIYKEDFSTGSKAAAFGGITCIFDMPNTQPRTTNINTVLEKISTANNKSHIDFGLYAAITDENIKSMGEISKYCSGFKIYLGSTTNSLQLSEHNLEKALRQAAISSKITLIHAENEQCLRKNKGIANNLKEHLYHRPSECEETSVAHILKICKDISSKIHICHLSSCEGFELLRRRPKNISVGMTPHHLLFDISRITSNETLYKVIPPLRSNLDRETLWHGIKNGDIDILESDHAPHSMEEKEVDFDKAPSGVPGVETTYPLFLAEVKKEHMSFTRLISLLCERPAELMNIPKGKLEVGRDADFIVINYKEMAKIKSDRLHSKCGWTPFGGMDAIFPSQVFSRGEKLIEDHEMLGRQGFGKFVGE